MIAYLQRALGLDYLKKIKKAMDFKLKKETL
jgi:hypothetical protein